MAKIAFFTDIHWGRKGNSDEHNQDCMDFINWFYDICVVEKVDAVGFLGDWFESRNSVDISTLSKAYQGAVKLSQIGVPIYFDVGNHDLYRRHTREFFSTVHYQDIDNFNIINTPTVVEFGKKKMLFCPFLFEHEYPQLSQYTNCDYWAGHFEFQGFEITSYGTIKDHGPSHNEFKKVQKIFSGHYHKRQVKDNVYYIGNTFPMDFGDAGSNERGMCLLDTNTGDVTFVDWKECPRYEKIQLSQLLTTEASFHPKTRVRCAVDEEILFEESNALKQSIVKKFKLREFTMEEPKISLDGCGEEEDITEEMATASVDELTIDMLSKLDTSEYDKLLLIDMYKQAGEFDSATTSSHLPIKFKEVTFRNFMSYGNNDTTISLDDVGLNLIVGRNFDTSTVNGSCANGVGKTTILHAICYALFDRALSNTMSVDNLINNVNKKNMYVKLVFSIGDHEYCIERKRKGGKSGRETDVLFYYTDVDGTVHGNDKAGSGETNKAIKEIIGLDYETFSRIVVFSAIHTPFLDLPTNSHYGACQIDIIEDLFKIKMLSLKADALKAMQKTMQQELDIQKRVMDERKAVYDRHVQQAANLDVKISQWELDNQNNITSYRKQIQSIENVDFDGQIANFELLKNLEQDHKDVSGLVKSLKATIEKTWKDKERVDDEILSLRMSQCPYCKQDYHDVAKIDALTQKSEACDTSLKSYNQELANIEQELVDITTDLNAVKKLVTVANLPALLKIRGDRDIIQAKIDQLSSNINPYITAKEEHLSVEVIAPCYDEINSTLKKIDHVQFLVKLLTKKDSFVRKTLLKRNLPYLNARLQGYIEELGLTHKVEFTSELTARISQFGNELSFDNLSNGQKARVNIALCFSFRDVLQRMHSPINLCLLDECLDTGLSSSGVASAIRMLKQKAKNENLNMYVITHRDEIPVAAFDKIITVEMEGGFSRIR